MSDQVSEIKQKADIVAIVEERMKLQRAGRNWKALCPFHSEKTPSFNVSPELQIFKCYGCGEGGDVFTFLEKFEGMTFVEALQSVADRVGVKLKAFRSSGDQARRERWLAVLNLAAEFYHWLLISHRVGKPGRDYLQQRGVWQKTIAAFRLGWAPDSWEQLSKYLLDKKGYSGEDLVSVGLAISKRAGGGRVYDRFRGRVMFPLTNQSGQVLGFAGRLLDPQAKEAKYVNSPETTLYHKGELLFGLALTKTEIRKADRAVVVEGELDALSSWQAGVKNVVAIKGSALTEAQLKLLGRYSKNLSLALDADKAGEASTKRGIATADKLGMNVRVVKLEGGKDPDEIVRNDKSKWKTAVKKAVNVYDFYLSSALKRWESDSGEGKRQISQELVPVLVKIGNRVERAHYINKLAEALGVSEGVVNKEVERYSMGGEDKRAGEVSEGDQAKEQSDGMVEEYVLGLLLRSGAEAAERAGLVNKKWLKSPAAARVVERLSKEGGRKLADDGNFDVGGFVRDLPEELKETVQRVWMEHSGETGSDDAVTREYEKGVRKLEMDYIKEELGRLAEEIEQREGKKQLSGKEKKTLRTIRKKFVEVSKRLRELG